MKKANVLNTNINIGPYHEFASAIIDAAERKKNIYACVANVHMLIEAHKNQLFANILNEAAIVTPDGEPLTWALKLKYGINQDRVAGMDLLPDLIEQTSLKKIPVFFYGGTVELLARTKEFLNHHYPDLLISGLISPPFRKLSVIEDEEIIQEINNSGAHLIFVILGCPKQEKWMASATGKINAVTIGVGGALPVFIGIQQRAPRWMQNAGLEWVFRLIQEPRRLFKRYAITNSLFIYLILKDYLQTGFFFKKLFRKIIPNRFL